MISVLTDSDERGAHSLLITVLGDTLASDSGSYVIIS